MKYHVTHETRYEYGEHVPLCHNVAHLRPRDTWRQTRAWDELTVSPAPALRRDFTDFFGNAATWFSVQEPHPSLTVTCRSEVDVGPLKLPDRFDGGPWEAAADALVARAGPYALDAAQFTFDSHHVPRHDDLAAYARPSFAPGRPLLACVSELTERICHEFTFDSAATTIGTPVLDVLRHRHGVCQDFAHLQIACLRSLGLAARYVSGYLLTRPPAGQERMVGADASHAWAGVFFPGYGWVDFDPTNGGLPSDRHVTVAWARDYDDVGPVKGVIVGGQRHALHVSVDVVPVDPKQDGAPDGQPPRPDAPRST